MKRTLLSRLAALAIICLASAPVLSATAQTPVASPIATADPFALPANLRILRIHAGNGFDYLRLEDGRLAYVNGDLVDDGLSTVPVPQWLETWYTDMRVVDHYMAYVAMVSDASAASDVIMIDIRLLSFPDHDAAAGAVPATYDVLLRQAEEDPRASQGIDMLPDLPENDGAIIGVTGTDPSLDPRTGAQSLFTVPFTRFIAQQGAIVASVKVASADAAFNDVVARELLATQLDCLMADELCPPVPIPADVTYEPGQPVATPAAARPMSRSRQG